MGICFKNPKMRHMLQQKLPLHLDLIADWTQNQSVTPRATLDKIQQVTSEQNKGRINYLASWCVVRHRSKTGTWDAASRADVFAAVVGCWSLVVTMSNRWPPAVAPCFSRSALANASSDPGYPPWLCGSENTAALLKRLSITISGWCT